MLEHDLPIRHVFHDRVHAGKMLAEELRQYSNDPDVIVLGLPRGGVPVAYEVAIAINAPLDVFIVRKLGVPEQEELALGAVASGGIRAINNQIIQSLAITPLQIEQIAAQESIELQRRERQYRDHRPFPPIEGMKIILVDDGLSTGSTIRTAAEAIRRQDPARLIIAVPTGAPETCRQLQAVADEVDCAVTPEPFHAVGVWYADSSQMTDDQVRELLTQAIDRTGVHRRESTDNNHGLYQG